MTYTRDPRGYPPAFIELVHAACLREVRIPCADEQDAKRLEGRLHAFFGTLHKAAAREPEYLALDNSCRRVKVKAVGRYLVAIPRDLEPDNMLIMAALDTAQPTPASGDVSMSPEMAKLFAQALTTPETGL
jgi:hypothetical protein